MTRELRYTLLADGGRDRALIPIIDWAILQRYPGVHLRLPYFKPRHGPLGDEIARLWKEIGPDLVVVHRDAERAGLAARRDEIPTAIGRVVRVVPVRMTEAWLLADETAIRRAAANECGRGELGVPALRDVEGLPDPKVCLTAALVAASGFTSGRRRRLFLRDEATFAVRVAECTADFAPLRKLAAFRAFEAELGAHLDAWSQGEEA